MTTMPRLLMVPQKLPAAILRRMLDTRQAEPISFYLPTTYNEIDDGPAPGTVAGIVLGSVGGVILLFWLLYIYISQELARPAPVTPSPTMRSRPRSQRSSSMYVRSRVVSEQSRVNRQIPTSKSIRSSSMPMSQYVPTLPQEPRTSMNGSRESRPKDAGRRPCPPSPSPTRSDEIVVIEEYSPPRRKKGARRASRESRRDETR